MLFLDTGSEGEAGVRPLDMKLLLHYDALLYSTDEVHTIIVKKY